jgi:hypothetical protein
MAVLETGIWYLEAIDSGRWTGLPRIVLARVYSADYIILADTPWERFICWARAAWRKVNESHTD